MLNNEKFNLIISTSLRKLSNCFFVRSWIVGILIATFLLRKNSESVKPINKDFSVPDFENKFPSILYQNNLKNIHFSGKDWLGRRPIPVPNFFSKWMLETDISGVPKRGWRDWWVVGLATLCIVGLCSSLIKGAKAVCTQGCLSTNLLQIWRIEFAKITRKACAKLKVRFQENAFLISEFA